MNHGCYNRLPFLSNQLVQSGWTKDGRRIMVPIPFRMAKECMYDLKRTDPKCAGCRWVSETV